MIKGADKMTLQQIKYAITIYETGQFSRAAEKLYVTQPSLTKAINELEKELGTTIFIRSKSGITVTAEGEEFISYARQLYIQYEVMQDRFITQKNVRKKFGVSCQHYSFAVKAFTETIRGYDSAEYEFAIREEKTSDVIHDVSTMRSEIGIIFISDFNEKIISKLLAEHDIVFNELMKCKAYAFVCRDNPLADREYVTFDDLQSYPCLIFEQGDSDPYFYAEELLPLHNYNRIVKTHDKLTMLNLIAEMNGYTLCTGMIYEKLNDREYISIPFKPDKQNLSGDIRIGYIVKKNRILTDIGKLYMENLSKNLK